MTMRIATPRQRRSVRPSIRRSASRDWRRARAAVRGAGPVPTGSTLDSEPRTSVAPCCVWSSWSIACRSTVQPLDLVSGGCRLEDLAQVEQAHEGDDEHGRHARERGPGTGAGDGPRSRAARCAGSSRAPAATRARDAMCRGGRARQVAHRHRRSMRACAARGAARAGRRVRPPGPGQRRALIDGHSAALRSSASLRRRAAARDEPRSGHRTTTRVDVSPHARPRTHNAGASRSTAGCLGVPGAHLLLSAAVLAATIGSVPAHAASRRTARSLALRDRGLAATSASVGIWGWAPDGCQTRAATADTYRHHRRADAAAALRGDEALHDPVLQ